jgi:hypothetical protein
VTTATGRVAYQLYTVVPRTVERGVLLVQLTADERIHIQVLPAGTPTTADFTGAACVMLPGVWSMMAPHNPAF